MEPVRLVSAKPVVYLVEDNAAARAVMLTVVRSMKLACHAFASASEFLEHYDPQQPGCLVLDIRMPGMSGLELQNLLNQRGAVIPIIFVTGVAEVPTAVEAMQRGAFHYLQKPLHYAALTDCVRRALEHDERSRRTFAERQEFGRRMSALTARERELLELLVQGHGNKSMAIQMGLSERTVELHRARVMEKMGAASLAQLVRMRVDFDAAPGVPGRDVS
jgi:two-component system, LuxR family, response regulator FixJ